MYQSFLILKKAPGFKFLMMQYRKVFVVFLLVLCGTFKASADGCALNYGTANEVIYLGAAPGVKNFTFPVAYRSGSSIYATACPKYDYNTAVTDNTTCTIVGRSGTFPYIPTSRISMLPCPIDDYLPWLFVFGGFTAVLVIRSSANVNAFNL